MFKVYAFYSSAIFNIKTRNIRFVNTKISKLLIIEY